MTPDQPEIKFATSEDIDAICSMCEDFFKFSPYSTIVPLDSDFIRKRVEHFIQNGVIVLHIGENGPDGLLVGIVNTALFADILMATEAAWWVSEDSRGKGVSTKLLDGFEYWAELMGCKAVCMSSLNTLNVDQILTNRGYTALEVAYGKVIS